MKFEAPAGSVRLFDLLTFKSDDAKKGAFFSIGDTLLVENLEIGR